MARAGDASGKSPEVKRLYVLESAPKRKMHAKESRTRCARSSSTQTRISMDSKLTSAPAVDVATGDMVRREKAMIW